jgi:hypothetical protein
MCVEPNVVFYFYFGTIVLCVNIDVSKENTSVFKIESIELITHEDGGSMFLQNVGFYLLSCKVSKPKKLRSDIKALFAYTAGHCTC